jgi:quercetin dioxygenase-like cupin family protein
MGENVFTDDWDPGEDWSGGGGLSKRLPRGDVLGATVYELGPGNFSVYHFHHGAEELLVVLRGTPTLRTPDGERVLDEGDVVHFPAGPAGAHALRNDTDAAARFLLGGVLVSAIGVAATFLSIGLCYAVVVAYGFVNPAFRRMDERRGSATAALPSASPSEPAP